MAVTWPGMLNGRIPRDQMVNVVRATDREPVDGDFLNPAAAYWWRRMQNACYEATGVWIDTDEAYRSYATQAWYAGPNSPLAPSVARATPGTSKHGWGRANDIKNYEPVWGWLQEHAGEYGWDWAEGKASGERWHWVFVGSLDATGLDFSIFEPPVHDEPKAPQKTEEEIEEEEMKALIEVVRSPFKSGDAPMPDGLGQGDWNYYRVNHAISTYWWIVTEGQIRDDIAIFGESRDVDQAFFLGYKNAFSRDFEKGKN